MLRRRTLGLVSQPYEADLEQALATSLPLLQNAAIRHLDDGLASQPHPSQTTTPT